MARNGRPDKAAEMVGAATAVKTDVRVVTNDAFGVTSESAHEASEASPPSITTPWSKASCQVRLAKFRPMVCGGGTVRHGCRLEPRPVQLKYQALLRGLAELSLSRCYALPGLSLSSSP